jgi:glycosyltransferase involved in cell wall biosynthesis
VNVSSGCLADPGGERSVTQSSLRILFVFGGWLRPELGAARGILDVAEAMRSRGHTVSTYSFSDTFLDGRVPRYPWVDSRRVFAVRTRRFIRAHAGEFDVIDANESCLPFRKDELGFDGILVANSCGLVAMYYDYLEYERRRWGARIPGRRVTQALARLRQRAARLDALRSLRASDLVRVLNPEEREWVANAVSSSKQERIVLTPCGLGARRRGALELAGASPADRLNRQEVMFIGTWTLRKGRADIPAIVDAVVRHVPEARFHFVGTYADQEVWSELSTHRDRIRVTPTYPSDALPRLLAEASVLMAPSYAEGLHLGVLEALAAGVPSVAYDIPGPRFMLSRLPERDLLAERGDVDGLAARVAAVLRMGDQHYADLSAECRVATSDLRSECLAEALEARLCQLRAQAR